MASRKWIVLFAFLALFTFMVEVRSSSSVTLEEVIQLLQRSVTALKSCNDDCTGVFEQSTILSANKSYQSHLSQFLAPAVKPNTYWVKCFHASIHGWAASTFHSRCDGKNDTVTIIQNGEYVFGGYTDIPWDTSDVFGYTPNAFIFSLHNKEGLGPFKSMVANPSKAIFKYIRLLPTFGDGYDLVIANNANRNRNSHTDFGRKGDYSVPSGVQNPRKILAGTNRFTPDDMEVFYLKRLP